MLFDVLMKNCIQRQLVNEMIRLSWTNDLIWSIWDRAARDAEDLFEVAEVYLSCLTLLRTCLMFESTIDENIYGMWPSIGLGRLECLKTFLNQVKAKMEARISDMNNTQKELLETNNINKKRRLEGRLNCMKEEISRLGMMDHITGMVVELIRERKTK